MCGYVRVTDFIIKVTPSLLLIGLIVFNALHYFRVFLMRPDLIDGLLLSNMLMGFYLAFINRGTSFRDDLRLYLNRRERERAGSKIQ
ncbi:hypothetical protein P170DRAFT_52030 [Aspergillus steynii IBT 23096]|uniref:Uncharacterized protein n=1 Tax=Aspergillus steynii IBT 23096 TaxID=1392250 RepID=A0A2I2GSM7_9EURO|nr:uncharacterized protein P170DRAFT_52030 [Aspergillus steynii IBT 23096]PLB55876.1 hypothetical protein P170DRAFT_52030 [Aspergillus steynii IBT 23096]